MLSTQVFVVLVSVLLCNQVSSYKILVMSPPPSRSHYNLGKAAADILHERKHEVTFVSAFKSDKPQYREIFIEKMMSIKDDSLMDFDSIGTRSVVSSFSFINDFVMNMTNMMMNDPSMKKLYENKEEKFDLVVMEHFMNDLLIGFGVRFDCPVVIISPMSLTAPIAKLTGNTISSASVPSVFLALPNNMNLWERTTNVAINLVQEVLGWLVIKPAQKMLYDKYMKAESQKVAFENLNSKIAIVLVNSHPTLSVARPFLPNTIDIGGYHIGEAKPLTQGLQKVLDNAKQGVIYFSMGSNLKSSMMSKKIQQGILKTFSKLKQTILWKFEEDLPGKPDNVIIQKWMPQDAILAHPNVKVFISHGGLLSCTEAVHHGVSILAIPIFGDQKFNARGIVEKGQGLSLDYANLTETSLTWALNEMLTNTKYQENSKKLNRIFHDRPMRPRDVLAFYVEHAIRSGGAPHLSPPRISRCAELLLDVIGLLTLPPLLIMAILIMTCRRCFRTKDSKKKEKDVKEKGGKQKKN